MKRFFLRVFVLLLCLTGLATGQATRLIALGPAADSVPLFVLPVNVSLPSDSGMIGSK